MKVELYVDKKEIIPPGAIMSYEFLYVNGRDTVIHRAISTIPYHMDIPLEDHWLIAMKAVIKEKKLKKGCCFRLLYSKVLSADDVLMSKDYTDEEKWQHPTW